MSLSDCPGCWDTPCTCNPKDIKARYAREFATLEMHRFDYQHKISQLEDEIKVLKGILDHYDIDHDAIRKQWQPHFLMTDYGKINDEGKVK